MDNSIITQFGLDGNDNLPMIILKHDPENHSADGDLFYYFVKLLNDKNRTFKINFDPFKEEKIIKELPEDLKSKKAEEIPEEYKKIFVCLGITLEEIKTEK